MVKVHIAFAIFWTLMIVPTLLFWANSILFIGFIFIYAIVEGHIIAATAAKARKEIKQGS